MATAIRRGALAGALLILSARGALAASDVYSLDVVALAGLRFGTMAVSNLPGAVTVTPDGSRTATGGVVLLGASSAGAAGFRVTQTGPGLKPVSILLPPSATLVGPGGATLTAGSFVSVPASGFHAGAGDTIVQVGATLQLNANQPPGAYSGTLDVIFNLGG